MSKYSQDLINQVISDYVNDMSYAELSVKYNIGVNIIRHWIYKRGIPKNITSRFVQKYEPKGEYTEIYIKSKGGFVKALIDNEDVERCKSVGIWSLTKAGYVINCQSGIYLHRFVMNCPKDVEVDHIYHNLLDNRKSQLRFATSCQQKLNTKLRADNKSGYRGVYYDKSRDAWGVGLKCGDKLIKKRFKLKIDAIAFSEKMIKELQGNYKYRNEESINEQ